jgi:hypothetical protein
LVDLLDFPLDPPDGERTVGGAQNFGILRSRFGRYHAGEDWGMAGGRSFGAPVHSIGHGRVTFAEPLGWGADKGVVILEHTFADGSTILSFYGHLDPPSVTLNVDDCVQRGDRIGAIGRPRSPPHLHFEIRSHMPTEPGPGYWAVDPLLAGWESPSLYIWSNRMAGAPGVQWMWSPASGSANGVGVLGDHTFVMIQDRDLVGINVNGGGLRWRRPRTDRVRDAVIDARHETIYVIHLMGELEAYGLVDSLGESESAAARAPDLIWTLDLDIVGIPTLTPLAEGGVVVHIGRQMFGVSPQGVLLWERDFRGSLDDWVHVDDQLLFAATSLEASLWTADGAGVTPWDGLIRGRLSITDDGAYLRGQEGVYRLDSDKRSVELHHVLPKAYSGRGGMVGLPDGGLLVAHISRDDRRLIALDADGTMRWQRSFADAIDGLPVLLVQNGRPYVLFHRDTGPSTSVSLYEIDMETAELTYIFGGATGSPGQPNVAVYDIGPALILIDIRGGTVIGLDVQPAAEAARLAARAE